MSLESIIIVELLSVLVLIVVMLWAGGYSVREALGLEESTRPESPHSRPSGGAPDGKSRRADRGPGGADPAAWSPVPTRREESADSSTAGAHPAAPPRL